MSAPSVFMTSCGATTLPSDFDILRPCASTAKPCVSTSSYGARPRIADRGQQRRLEPAAMLIGAFQIHHLVARRAREIRRADRARRNA